MGWQLIVVLVVVGLSLWGVWRYLSRQGAGSCADCPLRHQGRCSGRSDASCGESLNQD